MRRLYSFFVGVLLPLMVVRLYWKGIKTPSYRQRISERFANKRVNITSVDIWMHAVSLGEVTAVAPLVEKVLHSGKRVLITTTTPTGSAKVRSLWGDRVAHQYLPYDVMWIQRKFLRQIKPKLVLIMETELWPNMIFAAHERAIPLILINARLSESSFKGYKKIRSIMQACLTKFSAVATQSEADCTRFVALGANANTTQCLGNIKFDMPLPEASLGSFASDARRRLGEGRFIVLIASTHADEEAQVLSYFSRLKTHIPSLVLMIAPRHPERFADIIALSRRYSQKTGTRSNIQHWNKNTDLITLDCIGELLHFYAIADLAFVGGSLVPVGGHNILEPMLMGVPVISGDQMHNFKAISTLLRSAEAMRMVKNAEELQEQIIALYQSAEQKEALRARATQVLSQNRGALERYYHLLLEYLPQKEDV